MPSGEMQGGGTPGTGLPGHPLRPALEPRPTQVPGLSSPPVQQAQPMPAPRWPGQLEYLGKSYAPAGFWLRAVAFLIDLVLLSVVHAGLVELAQVPPPDLAGLLAVSVTLVDELASSGFPSQQSF